MAAPKGNEFWKARSSHGRAPIFANPEMLWDACCEYFQWCHDHPLEDEDLFAFQGVVTREVRYKMRAMTIVGLCIFLDINADTWLEYKKREDFTGIIKQVEHVIYQQKFSGAAAGMLNANIIARDLGLKDASTKEISGEITVTEVKRSVVDPRNSNG